MNTQISLKLSEQLYSYAKTYCEIHGFSTLQEFIRELMREKLFEKECIRESISNYMASEEALAKSWLSPEEDEAWEHLQKEI